MLRKSAPALLSLILAAFCCAQLRAESSDGKEDYRYEAHRHDGVLYRLDKLTGRLERLDFVDGAAMWTEVPVMLSGRRPTNTAAKVSVPNSSCVAPAGPAPTPPEQRTAAHVESTMAQLGEKKKELKVWDENNNDITETITDADRKAALPDVAAYSNELSTTAVISSKDRLTGIIMVNNKGKRRIQKMELTLQVPVVGKEKPEEFTYLFVDRGGPVGPPQPGVNGAEGVSLMQNVDLPAPPGGVKGIAEVKITYIKFYEK